MFPLDDSSFAPELAAMFTFILATFALILFHFLFTPWLGHVFANGSFPRSAALKRSLANYVTVVVGVVTLPVLIPCKLLFYRFQGVFHAIWRKVCWLYLYLVDVYDSIGVAPPSNAPPTDN